MGNVDIWKEQHLYYGSSSSETRFGYEQRWDNEDATVLQMTVDGKENRDKPKMRWRDIDKEYRIQYKMTTDVIEN